MFEFPRFRVILKLLLLAKNRPVPASMDLNRMLTVLVSNQKSLNYHSLIQIAIFLTIRLEKI